MTTAAMAKGLLLVGMGMCLYFLPMLVANIRGHRNRYSISIVNFFLGWTLIGWVVALAMAASDVRRVG